MEQPIRTSELSAKASISASYASEIINGKRAPSRALAIHIMRRTGWRHPLLADLTDEQITMLEQVEPWSPSRDRAA